MSKIARPLAYTEIQAAVGGRMAMVRDSRGIIQADAARALEMDTSTLNKIEKGKRAASIFNVIAFANRFAVSTDYLLRGNLIETTDEKLKLVLAAAQPELLQQPARMDLGKGKDPASGTPTPQARKVPVA